MDSIQTFFLFIQDQILGMKWLNSLIKNLLTALNVDVDGRLGGSIQFFIYDVLKITILLCFLIFIISYIQSYFPPERSKKILGRFHGVGSYIISALLGTVTPFCSCSSIPLFIGFTSAGLPLGVTFSFLISSPMVDLGSLVLLMSIFGAKIAIAYVIVGLMIAVAGGALIEKLHMEKYVEEFIKSANGIDMDAPALTRKDRLYFAREQVTETFKKVFPYILVGVGIGAAIHNWIPESWIQSILGSNNPFGVILATLVGIPMYADIFGTIPVAEALLAKGAQLGTILAFMMAVTTLSLPSMIMLKKAVKPKLLTHDLLDDGPEGDVLKHGEPREQRAVLEDHDAVGAGLRLLVGGAEHFAVEEDFPAADAVEARAGVEEGCFAASRRADDHAELAGGDVHGAAVHGKDLGAVGIVYLADVVDLDVPAHGRFVAAHRTSSLTFHCMRRLPIIRMSKLLNEPITPSVIMAMMITGYCTSMNEFQMR